MPKCPMFEHEYRKPSICKESGDDTEYTIKDCPQRWRCRPYGWLPFWTEAERAGIKAMGGRLKRIMAQEASAIVAIRMLEVENNILIFVRAVRAVKEAR